MMAAADLFLVAMGATPSQRPEAIRRFFQRCTAWRVAFYNVGLQVAQLVGQQRRNNQDLCAAGSKGLSRRCRRATGAYTLGATM